MGLGPGLLHHFKNPCFIETGTYEGEGVRAALAAGFEHIYTIDTNPGFTKNIRSTHPNVTALTGDSAQELEHLLKARRIDCPVTFWLDAHPFSEQMTLFDPQFPLMWELLSIRKYASQHHHNILIDDLRTYTPHDRSTLLSIVEEMWPTASSSLSDGYAPRDILCLRL